MLYLRNSMSANSGASRYTWAELVANRVEALKRLRRANISSEKTDANIAAVIRDYEAGVIKNEPGSQNTDVYVSGKLVDRAVLGPIGAKKAWFRSRDGKTRVPWVEGPIKVEDAVDEDGNEGDVRLFVWRPLRRR
jgi:hypothetical protein